MNIYMQITNQAQHTLWHRCFLLTGFGWWGCGCFGRLTGSLWGGTACLRVAHSWYLGGVWGRGYNTGRPRWRRCIEQRTTLHFLPPNTKHPWTPWLLPTIAICRVPTTAVHIATGVHITIARRSPSHRPAIRVRLTVAARTALEPICARVRWWGALTPICGVGAWARVPI